MLEFRWVDVFAERRYAGNQLAVYLNAAMLTTAQMQTIAREMNLAETTFILNDRPRADGAWDVRIFDVEHEMPFAGHPTLGTAAVIRETYQPGAARIDLALKVGRIPIEFQRDDGGEIAWMTQRAPTFGATLSLSTAASALGVSTDDIDPRFPVQQVSTGVPFVIIPLKTLTAAQTIRPNLDVMRELLAQAGGDGDEHAGSLLLFAPQAVAAGVDLHARMVYDVLGVIGEDPATGSANGCLAAWLTHYDYFGTGAVDCIVEQGIEMGRPSRLYLRAEREGEAVRVQVGGRVFAVARGTLDAL